MSKIKKLCISIIFFIGLILIGNKVNATSISVSPSEPKVGDEVKITVTVPNVHTSSVVANVSGVVSGTIKVVGGDLAGQAKNYSNSATFKCEKEGNINVEISSDSSAVLNGQYVGVAAQKTVAVKAKGTSSNTTNNSSSNNQSNTTNQNNTSSNSSASNNTATSSKSKEARLKNMGIKEKAYDFTGFKRDRKEYSIEVPNKITSLTVYATPVDSKAKVVGTGKVTLKEGDNTVTVTVTAEAGNTETYNLKIKRKTAAEEATGDTDETLTDNVSGAFGLSSLDIDDVNLSPGFDTEIYQYTIDLTKDLTSLEIETIPTTDDTTVEIFGNENLHEGENLITILVKNKKTGQTATYQITVNKNLQSTDVEGEGSEQVEEFSWLKPSTWGKEEIIKVAIVSVLIVLIIIAIILKVKLHKEKKAEKGLDLPGADELDRAIMEHQELSELDEFGEFEDKTMDEFNNDTDSAIDNNYDNQNLTNDYYDNTNYIEDIAKSRKNESNLDLDYPDDLNYQEYQDYPEEKSDKILKKKGKGKHF